MTLLGLSNTKYLFDKETRQETDPNTEELSDERVSFTLVVHSQKITRYCCCGGEVALGGLTTNHC